MRTRRPRWLNPVLLLLVCLLIAGAPLGSAADTYLTWGTTPDGAPEVVARVVDAAGGVTVARYTSLWGEKPRFMAPAKPGLLLLQGDQIWTGPNSWIEIEFPGAARVRVDPLTRVEVVSGVLRAIDPETGREKPTLRLHLGKIWVHVIEIIDRLRNFSVETPTAIAGVRGTLFSVEVNLTGTTSVSVQEGVVAVAGVTEPSAETLVGAGEETEVDPGEEPERPRIIPPGRKKGWEERREWLREQERWEKEVRERRRPVDFVPPGHGGTPPGKDEQSPGLGRTPSGEDGRPPGQDGTPPGKDEKPPGQDEPPGKDEPPGPDRTPPGRGGMPPGKDEVPPGKGGLPSGKEELSLSEEAPPSDERGPGSKGDADLPPGKDPDFVPPGQKKKEENGESNGTVGPASFQDDQDGGEGESGSADVVDEPLAKLVEELEQAREKIAEELGDTGIRLQQLWDAIESIMAEDLKRLRDRLQELERELTHRTRSQDERGDSVGSSGGAAIHTEPDTTQDATSDHSQGPSSHSGGG